MAARTLRVITGGASAERAGSGSMPGNTQRLEVPEHDTQTSPELVARERPLGPGDIVDRYRVERMIAAGGMARVYSAVHQFTGRVVALKVMRTRYTDRPDLIERFQNEAMALTRIRHPNVVNIENGGLTERGEVFIAMELLDGRTLRELLAARSRLGLEETVDLLCQVARGIAAAHDANVIHRDLKPENIFCTRDGGIKVLDLGLAKFVDFDAKETNAATATIGTAAYMSPEQLDGLPVDARSDVYSLGLIGYECLAGHHALVPEAVWPSREEVALRQLTYHPPALRALPGDVSSILTRAIHKDRARRYESMRDLLAALHHARAALDGVPSSIPPTSAPPISGPVSRKKPAAPADDPEAAESRVARRAILTGAIVGLAFGAGLYLTQRYLEEKRAQPTPPPPPATATATTAATATPAPTTTTMATPAITATAPATATAASTAIAPATATATAIASAPPAQLAKRRTASKPRAPSDPARSERAPGEPAPAIAPRKSLHELPASGL